MALEAPQDEVKLEPTVVLDVDDGPIVGSKSRRDRWGNYMVE